MGNEGKIIPRDSLLEEFIAPSHDIVKRWFNLVKLRQIL